MNTRITIILLALVLAGCLFSSGPSQDEALKAVVAEGELGNMGAIYKYSQFKLNECKEAVGRPGYVCDLSYVYNGAFPKRGTVRFVNEGGAWRVAEWQ